MKTTLSATATDWREGRRLRAWELHEQGWSQSQTAAALGGDVGSCLPVDAPCTTGWWSKSPPQA